MARRDVRLRASRRVRTSREHDDRHAGGKIQGRRPPQRAAVSPAVGCDDRADACAPAADVAAASALTATAYAVLAAALWLNLPGLLHLTSEERAIVQGPLIIVAIAGGIAQPLRAFASVLSGLQDVRFNGFNNLAGWLIGFVL